jgi:hypothetical protein
MTIKRTREIFGKEMEHMTDEEVQKFIDQQSLIIDALMDTAIKDIKSGKTIDDLEKDDPKI